jgi:hypothetical protein
MKLIDTETASTEAKVIESNRVHVHYESAALPTELRRRGRIKVSLACAQMPAWSS